MWLERLRQDGEDGFNCVAVYHQLLAKREKGLAGTRAQEGHDTGVGLVYVMELRVTSLLQTYISFERLIQAWCAGTGDHGSL